MTNTDTLFGEDIGNGKYTDMGIFVDVFPLDEVKRLTKEVKVRKWFISKLLILMYLNATNFPDHKIQRTIAHISKNKTLHRLIMYLMTKSNDKGYSYYANFGSQYNIAKQTQLIATYGKGTPLAFEDRKYMGPSEYNMIWSPKVVNSRLSD